VLTGALLACLATLASADVFRCTDNGKTVYQDTPCKTPGRQVDTSGARSPDGAADRASAALEQLRTSAAAQESERRAAATAAEVDRLERELAAYDRAEEAELAPLRSTLAYMNFNLPGAVWERSWAQESVRKQMQDVTDKYASKKQVARERLGALRTPPANATPAAATNAR
jgi:Domain of unknown function (DUF4124)